MRSTYRVHVGEGSGVGKSFTVTLEGEYVTIAETKGGEEHFITTTLEGLEELMSAIRAIADAKRRGKQDEGPR